MTETDAGLRSTEIPYMNLQTNTPTAFAISPYLFVLHSQSYQGPVPT